MNIDYIKCGDCLELIKDIPDNSIDLVVTDPPYILDTSGGGMYDVVSDGYAGVVYIDELNDIKDGFDMKILDELCRVMKKINIYLFCSQKQIIPLLDYFVKGKGCNYNILSWHKSNPVPACGNKYLSDTEYILFFREPGVKIYGEFDTKFTYYVTLSNKADKQKYGHPTIKPLDILNNLIINSSKENDIVLDPYVGSGSTCVSAINNNRHFIGYELDKNYFNIAQTRIGETLGVQSKKFEIESTIPIKIRSNLW